ncbi:MAG TPA: MYXO-CTERM sorting domain-containing protein [Polyangiaceae bacterium]|nr:MYXO-CTERM sorting domain-containing protein [Polyangiaceae bacterium]
MVSQAVSRRVRAFLSFVLSLSVLLGAGAAFAAGRIEWKSKELQEREGGSWRLELAFYMNAAPDVAHVPMKFEFQPIAYYERSMVDGDKLVERTVPLENRQALIESTDVGFLDSGSGKIEKRTRFSFKVTRAHGYEAGEYKVTVRDGRNGQTVGTPTTLIFKGENEIIDRRAMVFSGKKDDKKKKKDDEAKSDGDKPKDEGDKPKGDADSEGGSKKSDDSGASSDSGSGDSDGGDKQKAASDDGDEAGTIKEKPGGCGCRLEDSRSSHGEPAALLAALVTLGVVLRRRARA